MATIGEMLRAKGIGINTDTEPTGVVNKSTSKKQEEEMEEPESEEQVNQKADKVGDQENVKESLNETDNLFRDYLALKFDLEELEKSNESKELREINQSVEKRIREIFNKGEISYILNLYSLKNHRENLADQVQELRDEGQSEGLERLVEHEKGISRLLRKEIYKYLEILESKVKEGKISQAEYDSAITQFEEEGIYSQDGRQQHLQSLQDKTKTVETEKPVMAEQGSEIHEIIDIKLQGGDPKRGKAIAIALKGFDYIDEKGNKSKLDKLLSIFPPLGYKLKQEFQNADGTLKDGWYGLTIEEGAGDDPTKLWYRGELANKDLFEPLSGKELNDLIISYEEKINKFSQDLDFLKKLKEGEE